MIHQNSHWGTRCIQSQVMWSTPAALSAQWGQLASFCSTPAPALFWLYQKCSRNTWRETEKGQIKRKWWWWWGIKTQYLPPVRILQESAARAGGRQLGVNNVEAGTGQLKWNLWNLDFLRQRPQGAVFGRAGKVPSLFLLDFIFSLIHQPQTSVQGQQQQRKRGKPPTRAHVCSRVESRDSAANNVSVSCA